MDRNRLMVELTALPFSARCHRLYAVGLESRTDRRLAAILDEWERGDWQDRFACVQACTGSGDDARLQRMIEDSSGIIANSALKLYADHGTDDGLVQVLAKLTRARRHRLLALLAEKRRFSAIDSFLDSAFTSPKAEISELLPFGSAPAVKRYLSQAEANGGLIFWERLGRRHPQIAVPQILDKLALSEQPDGLLTICARLVARAAGGREPDLAVRLIQKLADFTTLSGLPTAELLARRPNELAKLILETEAEPFSLLPVARKIEPTLRLRVLRERPAALPFHTDWFRRIPNEERASIFEAVGRSWRDAEALLPTALLALLPCKERVAEAERMAALPLMATRPQAKAANAGYLPWARMREIADSFLAHPEGESRAWGWSAMLTSLRFHRDQCSTVLAVIHRRKFEQDPVRQTMLQGLSELPPGIWKAEHLAEIAAIVRDALDAADLSFTSALHLTAWLQKLIPTYPDWAAGQLVTIYRERGHLGGHHLESRINDQQARTLERLFMDVGTQWGRGNRVSWLMWFASALGRRLRVCKTLLTLLMDLLGKESGPNDQFILFLVRQHLPVEEFSALAKRLITAHQSWVALSPIFEFLHRHRQDWLQPFLRTEKFLMRGGSTIELVNLLQPGGYHRYTLAQQTLLAHTLSGIIRLPDGDRMPSDVWTIMRAISFLSSLPAADPSRLIQLASDVRPVIAEAAIRALGRLDSGRGVPTLITALEDARARLAIYALRQAVAEMPATQVMANLQNAPMKKVTVAKEIIRLIGEFGGSASFDWLLAVAKQDLHRDIRIALLRGLWDHLERIESWDVLTKAAQDPDGQILNGVVRIPADRLSENSRQRLIGLLTGLASHPDAMIRLSVLQRFSEIPLPDKGGRLIQSALALLAASSPDERTAAAGAIGSMAVGADATRIADAVGAMLTQRRPLYDFVETLTASALADAPTRRRLRPIAQKVLESLKSDTLTAGLRLRLAAGMLGVHGLEQELQNLTNEKFPISAVVREAMSAIEEMDECQHATDLRQLEHQLAAADDPHLRLLALVALIVQARDPNRWDQERRERMSTFRQDSAPVVAIHAQFCFDADSAN